MNVRELKNITVRVVGPQIQQDPPRVVSGFKPVSSFKFGDICLLTGVIYTMRDAAHARLIKELDEGEAPPFEISGATVYYMGPSPAGPGQVIGAAGPTTSGRMDSYTPRLIELGLCGMIGKGSRSREVVEAMKRHGAVYFGAIGGAGALLAKKIRTCEAIAYNDLGPEAVHRLEVEDFPVTVIIDSQGNDLYVEGRKKYLTSTAR